MRILSSTLYCICSTARYKAIVHVERNQKMESGASGSYTLSCLLLGGFLFEDIDYIFIKGNPFFCCFCRNTLV